MATYIGFTTLNAGKHQSTNMRAGNAGGVGSITQPIIYGKKFRLVDEKLVVHDLINAFNIQQGQKVGNPAYGTTIWSYIFSPNTTDVQQSIIQEVRRVASTDPRVIVNTVNAYSQEHGILIEMEIAVTTTNVTLVLNVFFNSSTGLATLQ